MKIVSWNLNGLMATMKNAPFNSETLGEPDVLCLQEIRTAAEPMVLPGYEHCWNHSQVKGYAGTVSLFKDRPLSVAKGFGGRFPDDEGRIIVAEYPSCFVVNAYVPNPQKGGKSGLKRQAYRLRWDHAFLDYVSELMDEKPVIICGDFNVARSELDYFEENMRQHWADQGYATDEQSQIDSLLDLGMADVFRTLYPTRRSYTWWSNRLQKREQGRGWRLDYFFIPRDLMKKVEKMEHMAGVYGSDHCPISLEVAL